MGTQRAILRRCAPCFGRGVDRRQRELNELTGAEWARASRSVELYPDVRSEKQRLHGAAFPESLAAQQIGIYTRRGQVVLDPFVGVGTTIDAALKLDRRGIGLDINASFIESARSDLRKIAGARARYRLLTRDSTNPRSYRDIPDGSVDMVLTSPPYGAMLRTVKGRFAAKWLEHSRLRIIANPHPYSDDPADLGNSSDEDYAAGIRRVFECTLKALRASAYAVWIVKDYRNLRAGVPFVNFHSKLAEIGESVGFRLWDIRIIDQTKYRPLVCLGYPSDNFYLNIGHSYAIVFRKR